MNGDGSVDVYDALSVRVAYGSKPGDPNWNPDADLFEDKVIDIYDALIVRSYFGVTLSARSYFS